jgi:hypothetical protein
VASTAQPSLGRVVSIYEPHVCLARQPSLNLVIKVVRKPLCARLIQI